jgi:hypothetical protein
MTGCIRRKKGLGLIEKRSSDGLIGIWRRTKWTIKTTAGKREHKTGLKQFKSGQKFIHIQHVEISYGIAMFQSLKR